MPWTELSTVAFWAKRQLSMTMFRSLITLAISHQEPVGDHRSISTHPSERERDSRNVE